MNHWYKWSRQKSDECKQTPSMSEIQCESFVWHWGHLSSHDIWRRHGSRTFFWATADVGQRAVITDTLSLTLKTESLSSLVAPQVDITMRPSSCFRGILFSRVELAPWWYDTLCAKKQNKTKRIDDGFASVMRTRHILSNTNYTTDRDSRVKWGKMPTLWIEAHILRINKWNSLKLIHNQKLVEFLICWDFLGKIYDIVEIKLHYHFPQKLVSCPICRQNAHPWGKTPIPWVSCKSDNLKSVHYNRLWGYGNNIIWGQYAHGRLTPTILNVIFPNIPSIFPGLYHVYWPRPLSIRL